MSTKNAVSMERLYDSVEGLAQVADGTGAAVTVARSAKAVNREIGRLQKAIASHVYAAIAEDVAIYSGDATQSYSLPGGTVRWSGGKVQRFESLNRAGDAWTVMSPDRAIVALKELEGHLR